MSVALEVEDVGHAYGGVPALDGVTFRVAAGETYGLLGPNGAGKTTCIRAVCGVIGPDRGAVRVCGEPMTPRSVGTRRHLGVVPQEVALYPELTGRENLMLFGRLVGLRGAVLRRRVDEVLGLLGLSARADDAVASYSGGMQRRCNIGPALLHEPRLVVLDEPTVGVDPQSRAAILDAVAGLADRGAAVLYTTHYMEEAERLCDRVGIIDRGRIIAEGTTSELTALTGQRSRLRVRLETIDEARRAARLVADVAGVEGVDGHGTTLEAVVADPGAALPAAVGRLSAAGIVPRGVEVDEPDLEAVFLHLTGRALRD